MNIYHALIICLGNDIEEEVTLSINGIELTCFSSVCPYDLHKGEMYPVLLEIMIFDEYQVSELGVGVVGLERIGNNFSYWITGRLDKGEVDCGIRFEDEILLSNYGYMDGKLIKLKVDRIDVEFLQRQLI